MACLPQLSTRALHERLDLIGRPAPCAPALVDLRLFPCLRLHPEFVCPLRLWNFPSFAELVDKVAGATITWCNAGLEIRKRLRPRRRIQSSQSCGRPEGSRRRGDKSSVCTPCSPRSSLLRVSCSVTGQNR